MNYGSFYRDTAKPPVRRSFLSYFITGIIGAVIGGILVLTFAPAVLLGRVIPQNSAPQEQKSEEGNVIIPRKTEVSLTTAIAKKVMPAVVGIRTTRFRENMFFGRTKVDGVGSGVIVDKKGYILTNNHVANDGDSDITVYLIDGRTVKARVVWTDESLDLSILLINADNLTVAEIGNSDAIEVGEMAVAIGNPLGLRFERSVTAGIVSALNRSVPVDEEKYMEDLIQTDASINEGNSGGPLINSEGKVIGINTIKVSSAEGMGFAIPINIAVPVIKSFVKDGEFKTPYIGLTGLDKEIASLYDYTLEKGIYVLNIDVYGPAYKAGIRKHDIIISINNIPVNTLTALKQVIFSAGVGNSINIEYQDRMGNVKNVTAVLGEK